MGWHVAAVVAMLVQWAFHLSMNPQRGISKAPPHHHTSTSMLHGGKQACRNRLFIFSALHEDTPGGTTHLKGGLIKPKHRLPLVQWVFSAQTNLSCLLLFLAVGFKVQSSEGLSFLFLIGSCQNMDSNSCQIGPSFICVPTSQS